MNFIAVLQIVTAIHKILYAADDNPSVVAEAQAMITKHQPAETTLHILSPILEASEEERPKPKRKDINTLEVDMAASSTLSPKQRLSDISDVHYCGSPLTNYWPILYFQVSAVLSKYLLRFRESALQLVYPCRAWVHLFSNCIKIICSVDMWINFVVAIMFQFWFNVMLLSVFVEAVWLNQFSQEQSALTIIQYVHLSL